MKKKTRGSNVRSASRHETWDCRRNERKRSQCIQGNTLCRTTNWELRWCPPQPPESWDGVRSCTEFSAACIQEALPVDVPVMVVSGAQSEDCLYLNVWSQDGEGEKRPVMLWIYGGGLGLGAASQPVYDGQHLARKGVVVCLLYTSPSPRD